MPRSAPRNSAKCGSRGRASGRPFLWEARSMYPGSPNGRKCLLRCNRGGAIEDPGSFDGRRYLLRCNGGGTSEVLGSFDGRRYILPLQRGLSLEVPGSFDGRRYLLRCNVGCKRASEVQSSFVGRRYDQDYSMNQSDRDIMTSIGSIWWRVEQTGSHCCNCVTRDRWPPPTPSPTDPSPSRRRSD